MRVAPGGSGGGGEGGGGNEGGGSGGGDGGMYVPHTAQFGFHTPPPPPPTVQQRQPHDERWLYASDHITVSPQPGWVASFSACHRHSPGVAK